MTCTCVVMLGEELCSSIHCLSGGSPSVFCVQNRVSVKTLNIFFLSLAFPLLCVETWKVTLILSIQETWLISTRICITIHWRLTTVVYKINILQRLPPLANFPLQQHLHLFLWVLALQNWLFFLFFFFLVTLVRA